MCGMWLYRITDPEERGPTGIQETLSDCNEMSCKPRHSLTLSQG